MTDISETPEAPDDSSQTRRRFLTAATLRCGYWRGRRCGGSFFGVMEPLGESESGWRTGAC